MKALPLKLLLGSTCLALSIAAQDNLSKQSTAPSSSDSDQLTPSVHAVENKERGERIEATDKAKTLPSNGESNANERDEDQATEDIPVVTPADSPEQAQSEQYRQAIQLISTREQAKMGQGIPMLEALVKENYVPAMDSLAFCYGSGLGVKANPKAGFELYEKAAKLGYKPSMKSLGECYLGGIGTEKDIAKGQEVFMKLWLSEEYSIAPTIASIYAEGLYGTPDPIAAAAWYRRGFEQGDIISSRYYANSLMRGEGVTKDPTAAYDIFKDLADNKEDPYAMGQMGLILWKGELVQQDKAAAIKYFRMGGARGGLDARRYLAYAYRDGEGVAQNQAVAFSILRDMAYDGSTIAQYDAALMLKDGVGTDKNEEEAYKLFTMSAKDGYNPALYEIAMAQLFGRGCKEDAEKAVRLLDVCRKKGSPDASIMLAICQREGLGMPQDQAKAHEALLQLAKRKCPGANYELGLDYEQGMGVEADAAKAKEYFEKAAAEGDSRGQKKLKH